MNLENKRYLSVAELANALKISRVAVFKKIKEGKIPAEKVGRAYVVSIDIVKQLLNDVEILTEEKKIEIDKAVQKVVDEYGETLKLLGKE